MVTVINSPHDIKVNGNGASIDTGKRTGGGTGGNNNGKRGGGGGGDDNDDRHRHHDSSEDDDWRWRVRYRIGIIVVLVTIIMMFAALTIAYLLASANSNWRHLTLPRWTWTSTILILLSSVALEVARRAWKRAGANIANARRWMFAAATLGLAFIASQVMSWRELAGRGVFLKSNPHSSFFYLLTGIHALHIVGGIVVLGYLVLRVFGTPARDTERQAAAIEAGAWYWHFVDGLWLYVLLLLWWR